MKCYSMDVMCHINPPFPHQCWLSTQTIHCEAWNWQLVSLVEHNISLLDNCGTSEHCWVSTTLLCHDGSQLKLEIIRVWKRGQGFKLSCNVWLQRQPESDKTTLFCVLVAISFASFADMCHYCQQQVVHTSKWQFASFVCFPFSYSITFPFCSFPIRPFPYCPNPWKTCKHFRKQWAMWAYNLVR